MFNSHDRFLPQLNDIINQQQESATKEQHKSKLSKISKQKSLTSSSSSSTATTHSSTSSSIDESDGCQYQDSGAATAKLKNDTNRIVLFNLPPLVTNSSIVRQRVSAKDLLAAASVTTGASLPLMIGGRSRCVVNQLVDNQDQSPVKSPPIEQVRPTHSPAAIAAQAARSSITSPPPQALVSSCGPKNTALRAEQRICRQQQHQSSRHNVISVVRPVVNRSPVGEFNCAIDQQTGELITSKVNGRLEDSTIWADQVNMSRQKGSLVDELMSLDKRITSASSTNSNQLLDLDDLLMNVNRKHPSLASQHPSEQQMRLQLALYRREQHELNRNVRRQHRFILGKVEDRKRNLQIVQSVWANKDFKHAIEKLVDIYNQGLIFTQPNDNEDSFSTATSTTVRSNQASICSGKTQLSSLNSSLVVDVLSVIILRPKLWTLEICQLVLPIVINDLLMQKASPYEYYIDVAIKSLKLILTHFSGIIKSTLESQKDSRSMAIGVDLSREDRINKCLSCYKLLMEARSLIARRLASSASGNTTTTTANSRASNSTINVKLASICRELEQCFHNCKP